MTNTQSISTSSCYRNTNSQQKSVRSRDLHQAGCCHIPLLHYVNLEEKKPSTFRTNYLYMMLNIGIPGRHVHAHVNAYQHSSNYCYDHAANVDTQADLPVHKTERYMDLLLSATVCQHEIKLFKAKDSIKDCSKSSLI
jgi:hypothetical protein